MKRIEQLEYDIELAKLDNAAFLVSKPGSQMSIKELADNEIRGNIIGILGDSIPIMKALEEYHDEQYLKENNTMNNTEVLCCHEPVGDQCDNFQHPCKCHQYKTPCQTCREHDEELQASPLL